MPLLYPHKNPYSMQFRLCKSSALLLICGGLCDLTVRIRRPYKREGLIGVEKDLRTNLSSLKLVVAKQPHSRGHLFALIS